MPDDADERAATSGGGCGLSVGEPAAAADGVKGAPAGAPPDVGTLAAGEDVRPRCFDPLRATTAASATTRSVTQAEASSLRMRVITDLSQARPQRSAEPTYRETGG